MFWVQLLAFARRVVPTLVRAKAASALELLQFILLIAMDVKTAAGLAVILVS